jgi:hypothetical protein
VINPGLCRDLNQRAMEQAIRALTLTLSAGDFGLVAFDAGDATLETLRGLPFTTWLRLERMLEGRQTVCVLAAGESMARSSAGLTVRLDPRPPDAAHFHGRLFEGLTIQARVVRARARVHEEGPLALATAASARG